MLAHLFEFPHFDESLREILVQLIISVVNLPRLRPYVKIQRLVSLVRGVFALFDDFAPQFHYGAFREKRVFEIHRPAHAAARTGVEFHIFEFGMFSVFKFFKHADDVFHSVDGKSPAAADVFDFSARNRAPYAGGSRLEAGFYFNPVEFKVHHFEADFPDRQHAVYFTAAFIQIGFYGRSVRRTRRNEKHADIFRGKPRFSDRFFSGEFSRYVRSGHKRHEIVFQVMETHQYKFDARRARRAYKRFCQFPFRQRLLYDSAENIVAARRLKHIVETYVQQRVKYFIHIVRVAELSEKRRRGQSYFIFEIVNNVDAVEIRMHCPFLAHHDAVAAVDAF